MLFVINKVFFSSWLHLINVIFKLAANKTFFFLSAMVKLPRNRIVYEKICDFSSHAKLTFKIKDVKLL
jgi:hypothetical protein